jgi:hypothetical protein
MARCSWVSFPVDCVTARNKLKPRHLRWIYERKGEFGEFNSPFAWDKAHGR